MKNLIILSIAFFLCSDASAQFKLRPQIGYNSSHLTKKYNDLNFGTEAGFQFGIDAQIGSKYYIQPGIFWESANNELKDILQGNNSSFEVNRIRIPVMVGWRMLGPEMGGLIDFRLFTGPNISFTVDKDLKQTSLISMGDFKNAVYGWNIGAGLDLALAFVDVGYSFGLSEVFEGIESSPRNNLFYINGGIRIGF